MAAKHVKKVKKVKNKSHSYNDNDLELSDILHQGGSKTDFELLKGIDEDYQEAVDRVQDIDDEPVKRQEVLDFVKSLGFDKVVMEETEDEPEKEKKVKLLKMPLSKAEQKKQALEEKEVKKKKGKNKFKVQVAEVSSSSDGKSIRFTSEYQPRERLLIKPTGKWFHQKFEADPKSFEPCSPQVVAEVKKYAQRLMESEAALYKQEQDSNKHSDARWIRTVLSSGTLADKTAALTLLIQGSPVHNLQAIDTLVGMVKKKCRREALAALDNVKELWLSDLLPDNRRMCAFDQHPLDTVEELASGNKDSRDKRILLWYFEDQLKERYEAFVEGLQAMTHDSIVAPKKKALSAIFDLLAGKPEQEHLLLTAIVNKLGDPDTKVATLGAHLLGKLVQRHANMKMVVCVEVENMLHRKNISEKAQYYGMCFLNQIVLSHSEKALAAKLIAIYFSFFEVYTEKKKVESKMLSALLTGVNRAFPYANIDLRTLDKQLNSIFRIVHIGQFNTALQALMLLFQVVDTGDTVMCDRYYQALYKKLLDPELQTTSRQPMFLNLLFKSLKKDDTEARNKAFVKRLLQISSQMSPTFICGSLVLVSELIKAKPALLDVPQINREIDDLDSEDEEEKFTDVKGDSDLEEDEGHVVEVKKALSDKGHSTVPSWLHRSNTGKAGAAGHYDPSHRNPMYCHAERECVWELRRLAKHYHPSVVLFANKVLKGEPVAYPGDPLQDFVLIRFLDRFVYRNPKKLSKNVVSSLDPRSRQTKLKGIKAIAVNDQKYLNIEEDSVPVDERFFYKYFKQQAVKTQTKRVKDLDSDAESIEDDEFDEFLEKYEANFEGGEDIEFNFAGEFDKEKSKHKRKTTDLDSDSEDDLDNDLSDEEMDFGDLEMGDDEDWEDGDSEEEGGNEAGSQGRMAGRGAGFDEEEVAFSDQDELEDIDFSSKTKKKSNSAKITGKTGKKQKMGKADSGGLFAAAEEFASMIDDNSGSKFDLIGSEAFSTKDNAHVKQLNWESHRDKWVRGQDWKSKRKQGRQRKEGKAFGKQKKKFKK